MEKVLEIAKLCMEVNELGESQVFFRISPHVNNVEIAVYEGMWSEEKDGVFMDFYYDDMFKKKDYEQIKEVLIGLKEEGGQVE